MRHFIALLIVLLTAHAGIAAAQPQVQRHKHKVFRQSNGVVLTVVCSQGRNADGSEWRACVG